MLQKIIMDGIKGQHKEQELTGRDIVVGRNGAGKTTRMQAMSLAAFGYVPGKGKTTAEIFELASEDTMAVGLVADDFEIARKYKKTSKLKADGTADIKISQDISISPSAGERTIKEKEQRLQTEFGNFPTMLDFSSFIELTDNGKRDFIYNLGGGNSVWDRNRVAEGLRAKVLREEIEINNPEMYEVMEKNYAETMKQYSQKADIQSGLLAMTEYAKDRLSYWKKEKTQSLAAAQKLTELKNRSEETDRDLRDNQEKLDTMEAEHRELIEKTASAQTKNSLITERVEELSLLNAEITEMQSGNHEEEIKSAKESIEKMETLLESLSIAIEDFNEHGQTLEKSLEDYYNRRDIAIEYISKMETAVTEQKAAIKAKSELIDKIQDNIGFCAFSRDIPCGHDFSGFIAECQTEIDDAYRKIDLFKDDLNSYYDTRNTAMDEIRVLRAEIAENQENLKQVTSEKDSTERLLDAERKNLANLENSAPLLTAKLSQKAEIEAWLEENKPTDTTELNDKKKVLVVEIGALKVIIEEQKRVRNDILNIKANIIDSKTATLEVECWQQIAKAIGQNGIQGEIVKEMLDPIRTMVDEKLDSIGLDRTFYFDTESDRGKDVFRFGWIHNETKRPFNALSQGEQLLLLICLMTTIIERSNPPIKILAIDNLNDLDKENMHKVIKGLNVAGKNMNNIILSGVNEPDEAEGWKVWCI